MKKRPSLLTYNEWTILRILWGADHSLARPEIMKRLPETRDWQPTAISTLITSMIEKGFLVADGVTRCGRGYGRTYAPTVERFDFITNHSMELAVDVPTSKRVLGLISSLLAKDELNAEEIAQLEQLVAQQKAKMQEGND